MEIADTLERIAADLEKADLPPEEAAVVDGKMHEVALNGNFTGLQPLPPDIAASIRALFERNEQRS